jgi:hypothetical protein
MKQLLVMPFLLLTVNAFSQNKALRKVVKNGFYCQCWISNHPDTIVLVTNAELINQQAPYSVVKKEKNQHQLLMWTGEISLETPTEIQKFKIRVRKNYLLVNTGKQSTKYKQYPSNDDVLLIKAH